MITLYLPAVGYRQFSEEKAGAYLDYRAAWKYVLSRFFCAKTPCSWEDFQIARAMAKAADEKFSRVCGVIPPGETLTHYISSNRAELHPPRASTA
jgi:hypothetical protein